MGTLQENQSLNAEYERNKKEREMKENIEYLNYCNEQLEKTNKNLNYKVEKLEEDYLEMKDNFRVANDEIERLNNIIESFEEELEREVNIKEENTSLNHNTYIDVNSTLKAVLKRFRELKGSDKE